MARFDDIDITKRMSDSKNEENNGENGKEGRSPQKVYFIAILIFAALYVLGKIFN